MKKLITVTAIVLMVALFAIESFCQNANSSLMQRIANKDKSLTSIIKKINTGDTQNHNQILKQVRLERKEIIPDIAYHSERFSSFALTEEKRIWPIVTLNTDAVFLGNNLSPGTGF